MMVINYKFKNQYLMKNIYLLVLGITGIFLFNSCNDEIVRTLQGEYVGLDNTTTTFIYLRAGDNQPVDFTGQVNLIAVPQTAPIDFTFEVVDSLSNAIENVHYTLVSNTGTIAAGATSGILPIQINPDNIDEDENIDLTIVLTSADVTLANSNPVIYKISVTCESNLAGTADYVHTENWAGEDFTGTVEFEIFDNTPGTYKISDFSFGSFETLSAGLVPTGTILFTHLCGVVNIAGTDQYGESWKLEEVIESGGPVFKFKWSDTYGDFGTVELTRQDGNDWPPMTK